MGHSEPTPQWQAVYHQRILSGNVTAFAELCEQALPHLLHFLQSAYPQADAHLQESVVIDCLLDYQAHPHRYDPDQLDLFAYLRMAVRGDVLNALDSEKRRQRRLVDVADPQVQQQILASAADDVELLDEWLQTHTSVKRQDVLRALYKELDEADRPLLMLMLEGVRETAVFAEAMGIADQDILLQRQAVKRAKDRIKKQMQRLGERLKEQ
jgi:DNA-directed RNA polymerase specialized sigma24 family protein